MDVLRNLRHSMRDWPNLKVNLGPGLQVPSRVRSLHARGPKPGFCEFGNYLPGLSDTNRGVHRRSNDKFPMNDAADFDDADDRPSKSERKRQSTELQELGEALIALPDSDFDALELPETLRDAVLLARRITARGGLYRQKQYIGKLMRKIDPEPIRAALEARREHERRAAVLFRRLEQWRDRVLAEGEPAIAAFAREVGPVDTALLANLVKRAAAERAAQQPPAAARALFQALRAASAAADKA